MHISTKCSVAIHCLVFIYEYGETHRVTSELLSRSSGANPVTIRTILSALKKEGILQIKPGTGGASLNCPPEEINLYRICQALEPDFLFKLIGVHPTPSPFCPVGRNIHAVLDSHLADAQAAMENEHKKVTLADLTRQLNQKIV